MIAYWDLRAVRDGLRLEAASSHNNVALHLFAENDTLREMLDDANRRMTKLEEVLDALHKAALKGASM